jgi:hypothetical protein
MIKQYSWNWKLTETSIWTECFNWTKTRQMNRVRMQKYTINAQCTIHLNHHKKALKGKTTQGQEGLSELSPLRWDGAWDSQTGLDIMRGSQKCSPCSSPLRSDGSRDDQAEEAGPVEQSSAKAKSLKTKGQGTVRLPPQLATAEAARRGARRPNKRTTLTANYKKETELKAALNWSTRRAKGSLPKKSTTVEKRKRRLL